MTVERSKRRCFLTLTFIVKSVSKNLLIQISKISTIFVRIQSPIVEQNKSLDTGLF